MRLSTTALGLLVCVLIAGCVTQTTSTSGNRRDSSDSGSDTQFDGRARAKARTDLAGGYYELRNFGVALEEARSAMAADPSYAPAHAMHALILME
ncbi:MAG: type IV pilus biogenesis/stability protein PilW, partial [Burkholderiales bacterium]